MAASRKWPLVRSEQFGIAAMESVAGVSKAADDARRDRAPVEKRVCVSIVIADEVAALRSTFAEGAAHARDCFEDRSIVNLA